MKKELDALLDIPCNCSECKYKHDKVCPMMLVKRGLKALEIIIKKYISPYDFILCNYTLNNKKWISYEEYKKAYMNYYEDDEYLLLEEEYDLLKEVLL